MKLTVLSDNRSCDSCLSIEHGLSILLQTERYKILLDTGASDVFFRNAELLGEDFSDVDYVFILMDIVTMQEAYGTYWSIIKKAQVIVSPDAISGNFFSKRGNLHSITTGVARHRRRQTRFDRSYLRAGRGSPCDCPYPSVTSDAQGNQNLYVQNANGDYIHDDFRHELALYVDGLLFTGCAHSGLENILLACPWPVYTVVGGFHLLDGQETDEEIKALAQRLKAKYPDTLFYTSHCTGDNVFEAMKNVMGEQLQPFSCGYTKAMKEMLLYYIVGVNILAFLVYGIDKWRAKRGKWRISEATLLLLAVIGGSLGAWLGMKVWHHKTMHKKFKHGIPAILIIQILLIGYSNFTPNVSYIDKTNGTTKMVEKVPSLNVEEDAGTINLFDYL